MRTIKFRGKSEEGEWIIGHYVGKPSMDEVCILPFQNVNYHIGYINDSECYYCIADTLGQFTGLYDKNGKEIYEGDILYWDDNNRLYVVTFESGMFYASVRECNEGFFGGFPLHAITENGKCKIVGNIYDNQELLKKLNTMTEKEKAKAYDEAIERASAAHKDEDKHLKATLERIFPELKERY